MRSRQPRRVTLACASAAIGIIPTVFGPGASAADRSWIDPGGGAFATAGNWSPATVPGLADAAHFTMNNAYTVSFAANHTNQLMRLTQGTVTFNLGGTRTYAHTSNGLPTDPSIAVGIGSAILRRQAHLVVSNGTLSGVNAMLGIGSAGSLAFPIDGLITVTTGGRLNLSGGLIAGWDTEGAVSVSNGGDVTSTGGATLGYGSFATGAVTVSGAGSTWTTQFANVGLSGDGSVTIAADADVTTTLEAYLARNVGSTGNVTVTGAGSSWTHSGTVFSIGTAGAASLTVSSGGTVTGPSVLLGDGTGSTGVALVTGTGSSWGAVGSTTRIGNFGSGALTVSNGGSASFGGTNILANRAGSTGVVTVTGTGSHWRNFQVIVGNDSTGSLSITNGGTVESFGAGAFIGNNGSGRGNVLIDGPGSRWEIGDTPPDGGLGLSVGGSGLGSVTIQNGGALFAPAVKIASEVNEPGSGTVLVTGANSLLTSTGSIVMTQGVGAAARMTIDAGGTVNAGELVVGPRATVVITGGNLFAGPVTQNGTFTQTGGTVNVGPVDGSSSITLAGGASFAADYFRVHTMTISGDAVARVKANGTDAGVSVLKNLVIGGSPGAWQGTFNVGDNDLVIDYDVVSPLLNVADQIRTAYNGGAWNGPGGITSASADASNFGLGFAESSSVFTTFPATFSGQSVDNTAVLVKFTRYGDANLDGQVNLQDFNTLASNFGQSNRFWRQGDFNYDGTVNLQDFNRLAANFGLSAAGPDVTPADWSALAAAVPEPMANGIVFGVACVLASRRRRARRG